MRHELATLALWLLAAVVTFFLVEQSGAFTYLGPLFFACAIGSIYIVRSARKKL